MEGNVDIGISGSDMLEEAMTFVCRQYANCGFCRGSLEQAPTKRSRQVKLSQSNQDTLPYLRFAHLTFLACLPSPFSFVVCGTVQHPTWQQMRGFRSDVDVILHHFSLNFSWKNCAFCSFMDVFCNFFFKALLVASPNWQFFRLAKAWGWVCGWWAADWGGKVGLQILHSWILGAGFCCLQVVLKLGIGKCKLCLQAPMQLCETWTAEKKSLLLLAFGTCSLCPYGKQSKKH